MKVETSTCTKVVISELLNSEFKLDPITVFLEDFQPGKGRIVIECYGKSWSSYWGAMGDDIATFFCRCDEHYIAKNLSGSIQEEINDFAALPACARKNIIQLRKDGELDPEEARELFDEFECAMDEMPDSQIMFKVFGDDWWYSIPQKPNPDYEYLCRIINAVKAGLKSLQKEAA